MRDQARSTLIAAVALAAASTSACGPERTAAAGTGLDAADRPATLAFDTLFTVGKLEGEAWETFGSVSQVAFDASGRLYVFDQQNSRIVVVGPDGSFVREVGKKGGGPGEFQNPLRMAVARDGAIAVSDFGVSGFTLFDPEGTFTETVRITSDLGLPFGDLHRHPTENAVLLQDASMLRIASGAGRAGAPSAGIPEQPPTIPIRKVSLETGDEVVLHEAWRPPRPESGSENEISGRNQGGGRMVIRMSQPVAFQPRALLAVLPDGRYLLADSSTYAIDVLGPDGAVQSTLERPIPPTAVTDDIREAEKARRLEALDNRGSNLTINIGGRGGALGGDMAKQIEDAQRAQIEALLFADVVPVLNGLAADWSGRIWVERTGEMPGEQGPIDLIDADGRYYGTIDPQGPRIPAAFGPDGLVAYIEKDEYDVQTVRVMRLRPEDG